MSDQVVIRPDLAWIEGDLRSGREIVIGSGGLIEAMRETADPPTHPGMVALPGFVNAHSHAFQRGLRGRGERFPQANEDFWSWREAMYALVAELDRDRLLELAIQSFSEMRQAGITTVGEFHYVHHDSGDHDWAFDEVMLEAAATTGIRLVLLQAYYVTGGFDTPLTPGQRRFDGGDVASYWNQFDRLEQLVDGNLQRLGVVAHSLRAVPREDLVLLHEESRRRGLVFHMHVEEQPAEIEACRRHYGATPTRVLLDSLALDERFTAVHDTHTHRQDMTDFLATGAQVCLCPLTEANLGDGLADVTSILAEGGRIALGSDSNARISMLEEMRLVEYGQRLQHQRRGICRADSGRIDRPLLAMSTVHGGCSLGLPVGRLEVGYYGDLVLVDRTVPSLAGVAEEDLTAAIILGAAEECICTTLVGGRA